MNKRGEGTSLLEALFWLIVAVVGIILLIYAFDKFLGLGCTPVDKEQAKAKSIEFKTFLDNLVLDANGTIPFESPTNWWLVSYKTNDANIPPGFFMQNLACICDKEDCTSSNFCVELKQPIFENTKNLKIQIYFTDLNVTNKGTFYDVISIKAK
jgi:hypothetical protein